MYSFHKDILSKHFFVFVVNYIFLDTKIMCVIMYSFTKWTKGEGIMIEEEMLRSYINMSSIIKENRLLNYLSFNEIMVMNLIVEEEMPFKVLQKRLNI